MSHLFIEFVVQLKCYYLRSLYHNPRRKGSIIMPRLQSVAL